MPSTCLLSRDGTFLLAAVLPDGGERRHPMWAWRKMHKGVGKVYTREFGWSVGHPTYPDEFCSRKRLIFGACFEVKL
jgi:hypothetical protein